MEIFNKLYRNLSETVSKEWLIKEVYKDVSVQVQTINVHMSNLRRKIKNSQFLIKSTGKGRWKMIDKFTGVITEKE